LAVPNDVGTLRNAGRPQQAIFLCLIYIAVLQVLP